jgi:hypothetical protein
MPHLPRLIAFCTLLLATAWPCAAREYEPIKPPFGLAWGETQERLERLLKSAKATIVERRIADGREVWDVEGIIQPGLRRTVFYFRTGSLVEVELQYQKDDWGREKYDDYMAEVRKKLDERFGAGQQIANKTEPNGEVTQTVVSWKWNQNNSAIELVYFAAEGPAKVFRTLSVHYRAN